MVSFLSKELEGWKIRKSRTRKQKLKGARIFRKHKEKKLATSSIYTFPNSR